MAKLYQFYCEICNWKKIASGDDCKSMVEVKSSPIQTRLPHMNSETGKFDPGKTREQPKKFKCPNCGRIVKPKIVSAQPTASEQLETQQRRIRRDALMPSYEEQRIVEEDRTD